MVTTHKVVLIKVGLSQICKEGTPGGWPDVLPEYSVV